MAVQENQGKQFFAGLSLSGIYRFHKGAWNSGETPPDLDQELSWWAPHRTERVFLNRLIKSVAVDPSNPLVVDAGCGTGFVGKLIAAEISGNVLGVDIDDGKFGRLPNIEGAALERKDVWDLIDQFGPTHPQPLANERRRILDYLKEDMNIVTPYINYHGNNCGLDDIYQTELTRLQGTALETEQASRTDLVICSYMAPNVNLTIPVRDGLVPGAIVYVREISGNTGAGDYYLDQDLPLYTPISFHPGENYLTAARWRTFSKNDWHDFVSKGTTQSWAEVVVQLRKDVVLKPASPDNLAAYPWDNEIEKLAGVCIDDIYFFQGVNNASKNLFKS